MSRIWLALVLAALPLAAQTAQPVAARTQVSQQLPQQQQSPLGVKRASMQIVENNLDRRLTSFNPADSSDLTGNTRGVYLPGFGVVLTAEIALVKLGGPSPFHQTFTVDEKLKARARKLEVLPKLREAMKAALSAAASELPSVPLNEKIVIGVTLFHWNWEDPSGLPAQIVMQATRQQLATHAEAIQVQEF